MKYSPRAAQPPSQRRAGLMLLARLPGMLILLSVAVISGILLAAGALMQQTWVQMKRDEEQATWALALAATGQFNGMIGRVNTYIDAFAGDPALAEGPAPAARHLRRDVATDPDLFGGLILIGQGGRVLASTSPELEQAATVAGTISAAAARTLSFAAPLTVNGERLLPMTRPVGGLVADSAKCPVGIAVFIRVSTLEAGLAPLIRIPGAIIGVFEANGVRAVLLPRPTSPMPRRGSIEIARTMASNITSMFLLHSPRDHRAFLTVVMRNNAFPSGVMVSLPADAFFAAWWPRAFYFGSFALVLIALMLALDFALARELECRRRAEAQLAEAVKESERVGAQYQMLANHSSDVIMQIGFDGICRYVSPSTENLSGWTPAELVGRNTRLDIHPDDLALLVEEEQFLTTNCGPLRTNFRLRHRNGDYLWIEAHMQLVTTDSRSDSFIANLRDITDRIETENKLAHAASEMAKLAATDQLTGLANRRRFTQDLQREWRRATREELPLSVLLLDVDFFKLYNDSNGHAAGDSALKLVASTIGAVIQRPGDLPARWGGEEFIVLLPGTPLAGAVEVAAQIRAAVEAMDIPHRASPIGRLTVSIGVACAYPTLNQAPEPLIAEADANLYEAKHQGRNRVGAAPTEVSWVKA